MANAQTQRQTDHDKQSSVVCKTNFRFTFCPTLFMQSLCIVFGTDKITAGLYANAVYAVVACLAVCHKPVLYRNVWTNRDGFWHGGFFLPIPHYVTRKYRYLRKLAYFPLRLRSRFIVVIVIQKGEQSM